MSTLIEDPIDEAKRSVAMDGQLARYKGEVVNPYPENSDAGRAWHAGWMESAGTRFPDELRAYIRITAVDRNALRKENIGLQRQLKAARSFINAVFAHYPDIPVDGFDLHDFAVEHGILVMKEPRPTRPCGEGCNCVEYYGADEWADGVECYHLAEWLSVEK